MKLELDFSERIRAAKQKVNDKTEKASTKTTPEQVKEKSTAKNTN